MIYFFAKNKKLAKEIWSEELLIDPFSKENQSVEQM
jgi:hypothetical protein